MAESADARATAKRIADRADIPLLEHGADARVRFLIRASDNGVVVESRATGFGGPVTVDFSTPDLRRRIRGGRRQPLARAVGLHRSRDLSILDATGGFGRDGFVLAALGARVTLCERNPLMYALLEDALARVRYEPWAASAADRLDPVHADAGEYLRNVAAAFDVVYLDPMYPHRRKTALPKKEMRVLRALVGDDADAPGLLQTARAHAGARVVVKRPPAAAPLADAAPDFTYKGKQARYDVYLKKP